MNDTENVASLYGSGSDFPAESVKKPKVGQKAVSIKGYVFGLDRSEVSAQLRRLADAIEAGSALVQEVDETTKGHVDDFRLKELRLVFAEPIAATA